MNSPYEIFMAQQVSAPAQEKSAAELAFENAYWDTMAKAASVYENQQIADLFNEAFEAHTQKLASLDPEYAAMIVEEQQKQAFNAAFESTVKEARDYYAATYAQR